MGQLCMPSVVEVRPEDVPEARDEDEAEATMIPKVRDVDMILDVTDLDLV